MTTGHFLYVPSCPHKASQILRSFFLFKILMKLFSAKGEPVSRR
jgi:hypothetical protein